MTVQAPPRDFTGEFSSRAPVDRKGTRPIVQALIKIVFGAPALVLLAAGVMVWTKPDGGHLQARAAAARARVIAIVNQPVAPLPRRTTAREYSPGWFHEGALKPDFDTVDVRTTQEFPYENEEYVTSNLNPSAMFRGRELEFNSMTKLFYVDRTLPKKRLSEPQMIEINRLYRDIGRAERASTSRWEIAGGLVGSAFFMLLAMGFQLRRPG